MKDHSENKGMGTGAVVVTYNPNIYDLEQVLLSTAPQVDALIVVDNGSNQAIQNWLKVREKDLAISILLLGDNYGIAYGHNKGIEWARGQGFSHVLLMDQDSIPDANMVERLIVAFMALEKSGEKVAAVGPRFLDPRSTRQFPFIQVGTFLNKHIHCLDESGSYIPVDFLISSGTLIVMSALTEIGGMEEGLFIDNVDMEWCFRVRAKGFSLYGICDARMQHSLGDTVDKVWFLRQRNIIKHPPIRLYYIMRNRILLYKRSYTPVQWICQDFPRLIVKLFLFSVIVSPRSQHSRMMMKGIWHGIKDQSGKL